MIRIEHLGKRYGDFVAVDDLSLEIPDGQFTVLLGPSGSGKTTILRMLNRMVVPSSGTVHLDSVDLATEKVEDLRRHMGYVIQNTGLFPNMTVRRNVAAVPRLLGWKRPAIDARVDELLDMVGLEPHTYASKFPSQLSGGEAQRVGVARALAADPPVILMDEPFGAVDPITRTKLQFELKLLHERLRKTIVFVTHDIDEAVLLADRIVLLKGGVLQQYARAEDLWKRPANDFVRDFFGDDLALRIMQRHRLGDIVLLPPEGDTSSLPQVDASKTLKDGLAELVSTRSERIAVVSGGTLVGTATFGSLVEALGTAH
jgi:osmoprotectant transport system ATP-binding protein